MVWPQPSSLAWMRVWWGGREEGSQAWQEVVDRRMVKCWGWKTQQVVYRKRVMVQVWGHQVAWLSGGMKRN